MWLDLGTFRYQELFNKNKGTTFKDEISRENGSLDISIAEVTIYLKKMLVSMYLSASFRFKSALIKRHLSFV